VFSLYGVWKANAIAAYDPHGTIDLRALITIAARDRVHLEPVRMTARAFVAKGSPVYVYRFSYVRESMRQRSPDGASHGSEIPFVFGTLGNAAGAPGSAPSPPTPGDLEVSKTVQAYWVNFAKTGNPNGSGLTNWPRYDASKDVIFDFRPDGSQLAAPDPWKARLDVAEHLSNTTNYR
jgi:para-nitrobenzyl esterase